MKIIDKQINAKNTISIIIPFYNEEDEISSLLNDIEKFEQINNSVREYIFINDSSIDASLKIVKIFCSTISKKLKIKIKIINNKKNIGWAKSVCKGYNTAKGDYLMFVPGDGEVKLTNFFNKISLNCDVTVIQRGSMPGRPLLRILISYIFRILVSIVFRIKLFDYNTIIILKKKVISTIKIQSNSFFINAEIIVKSFYYNFSIDYSQKLKLYKKKQYKSTSLSFKSLFKVIRDFFKTFKFVYFN